MDVRSRGGSFYLSRELTGFKLHDSDLQLVTTRQGTQVKRRKRRHSEPVAASTDGTGTATRAQTTRGRSHTNASIANSNSVPKDGAGSRLLHRANAEQRHDVEHPSPFIVDWPVHEQTPDPATDLEAPPASLHPAILEAHAARSALEAARIDKVRRWLSTLAEPDESQPRPSEPAMVRASATASGAAQAGRMPSLERVALDAGDTQGTRQSEIAGARLHEVTAELRREGADGAGVPSREAAAAGDVSVPGATNANDVPRRGATSATGVLLGEAANVSGLSPREATSAANVPLRGAANATGVLLGEAASAAGVPLREATKVPAANIRESWPAEAVVTHTAPNAPRREYVLVTREVEAPARGAAARPEHVLGTREGLARRASVGERQTTAGRRAAAARRMAGDDEQMSRSRAGYARGAQSSSPHTGWEDAGMWSDDEGPLERAGDADSVMHPGSGNFAMRSRRTEALTPRKDEARPTRGWHSAGPTPPKNEALTASNRRQDALMPSEDAALPVRSRPQSASMPSREEDVTLRVQLGESRQRFEGEDLSPSGRHEVPFAWVYPRRRKRSQTLDTTGTRTGPARAGEGARAHRVTQSFDGGPGWSRREPGVRSFGVVEHLRPEHAVRPARTIEQFQGERAVWSADATEKLQADRDARSFNTVEQLQRDRTAWPYGAVQTSQGGDGMGRSQFRDTRALDANEQPQHDHAARSYDGIEDTYRDRAAQFDVSKRSQERRATWSSNDRTDVPSRGTAPQPASPRFSHSGKVRREATVFEEERPVSPEFNRNFMGAQQARTDAKAGSRDRAGSTGNGFLGPVHLATSGGLGRAETSGEIAQGGRDFGRRSSTSPVDILESIGPSFRGASVGLPASVVDATDSESEANSVNSDAEWLLPPVVGETPVADAVASGISAASGSYVGASASPRTHIGVSAVRSGGREDASAFSGSSWRGAYSVPNGSPKDASAFHSTGQRGVSAVSNDAPENASAFPGSSNRRVSAVPNGGPKDASAFHSSSQRDAYAAPDSGREDTSAFFASSRRSAYAAGPSGSPDGASASTNSSRRSAYAVPGSSPDGASAFANSSRRDVFASPSDSLSGTSLSYSGSGHWDVPGSPRSPTTSSTFPSSVSRRSVQFNDEPEVFVFEPHYAYAPTPSPVDSPTPTTCATFTDRSATPRPGAAQVSQASSGDHKQRAAGGDSWSAALRYGEIEVDYASSEDGHR